MFEESLKQARRLFFLIATTAVAVCLFAFTAKTPDDPYEKAHTQVAAALSIDWNGYLEHIEDSLRQINLQRYQANIDAYYGYIALDQNERDELTFSGYRAHAERAVLPEASLSELLTQSEFYPVWGQLTGLEHVEIGYRVDRTHAPRALNAEHYRKMLSGDKEPHEMTPVEIVRLVTSPPGQANAGMVVVDPGSVKDEVLRGVLHKSTSMGRGKIYATQVSAIVAQGDASLESTELVDIATQPGKLPKANLKLQYQFIPVEQAGDSPGKWQRGVETRSADAKLIEVPDTSFAAWLGEHRPKLGTVQGRLMYPFLGLGHVWPMIADRSLLEAELYLKAGLSAEQASTPKVSLGGVELPSTLVPLAGPTLIAMLVLQLLRFLGFAASHAEENAGLLKDMPWLVLQSPLGYLEAAAVVIMFPVAAQLMIQWQAPGTNAAALMTGWIATAVSTLGGIRVFLLVRALRSKIRAAAG